MMNVSNLIEMGLIHKEGSRGERPGKRAIIEGTTSFFNLLSITSERVLSFSVFDFENSF
jgi:chromosome segregation and condensation protein ScpB